MDIAYTEGYISGTSKTTFSPTAALPGRRRPLSSPEI
ncbi:hypothetical protein M5E87_02095 [Flavonifractor plautii]|nr:hypothetical protein M5E87_02095 [Flavonifractor plautii]